MKTLTPREILSLVSIGCAAFAVFAGMVFASDRARRRKVLSPVPPEVELLDQVVYAAGQPQYILLPTSRTPDGEVVTCWKPNFAARLAFLYPVSLRLVSPQEEADQIFKRHEERNTVTDLMRPLTALRTVAGAPNPFVEKECPASRDVFDVPGPMFHAACTEAGIHDLHFDERKDYEWKSGEVGRFRGDLPVRVVRAGIGTITFVREGSFQLTIEQRDDLTQLLVAALAEFKRR